MQLFPILPILTLVFGPLALSPAVGPPPDPQAAYLEQAALSWMRLPDCDKRPLACEQFQRAEQESVGDVRARIHEVAGQVSEVAGSLHEGLVLMSIALNECRFRGFVDDGRCNDPAWRKTRQAGQLLKYGTCDSGRAFSMWQIWPTTPEEEQVFRAGWASEAKRTPDDAAVPHDTRLFFIRKAKALVDASLAIDGTLRRYSGETDAEAPKAFTRLRMAEVYAAAHPFRPRGIVSEELAAEPPHE
jgi:hypothetical protein